MGWNLKPGGNLCPLKRKSESTFISKYAEKSTIGNDGEEDLGFWRVEECKTLRKGEGEWLKRAKEAWWTSIYLEREREREIWSNNNIKFRNCL